MKKVIGRYFFRNFFKATNSSDIFITATFLSVSFFLFFFSTRTRRENTRAVFLTLTRLFGKCMQVGSQAYRLPLVPGIILGPSGFPRESPTEYKLGWIR